MLLLVVAAIVLFVVLAFVVVKWLFIGAVIAALIWLTLFFFRRAQRNF